MCFLKGVRAKGQIGFMEGRSSLDHILKLHILIEQEVFASQCLYSCFVDTIPHDKLWARLQRLDAPPHLQHFVKAMYSVVYTKVRTNGNTMVK